MTSGGWPKGYCYKCGTYSQSRPMNYGGLCLACEGIVPKQDDMDMGGLIPDPLFDLRRRIDNFEARLAELEKGKGKADREPRSRKCPTCKYEYFYAKELPCRVCDIKEDSMWEPKPDVSRRDKWEPEYMVHLESEWEPTRELEKLNRQVYPYILQLQWLFEHYPEQNGEWSEKTEYSIRYDMDNKEYVASSFRYLLPVTLVYMSLEAARHLRDDMNTGKVRFHD